MPLAEPPSPSKSLSVSSRRRSDRSSISLGRIARKHRQKQRKPRLSVKFTAQNFVKNHELGDHVEDFYDIGEKVGEGGFGVVFSAIHKKTGAERAIKVIYKTEDDDEEFEKVNTSIKNEFNIVKSLDHPNLIKQYEMFEDDDKFMIVSDMYRGGELLDELESIGCFQEDDAALLLNHMLTCINYVHSNNLAHRDLKPENVLLEENMKLDDIKIIDFGLARRFEPGSKFEDYAGTSYYMSPQIVKQEPHTNKCDVWACGVIAFMVLGGYAPFDGEETEDILDQIEEGKVIFEDEPETWDTVSDTSKEFIRYLLAYEEDDRPTAHEALQHPWLVNIRKQSRKEFQRESSFKASKALENMEDFEAGSKLKQATYALVASQLLLKEEKEEIDEVFRVLDADCSGRLGKEEVRLGYAEFFGHELSDAEVDVIFRRVNISGSGFIEYSEFVVASLMGKELLDDDKLKAAFEEFDLDGNGQIDLEELKTILVMDDDMDDYVINNIIKQVDTNGDGEISFDEFKSMMYITNAQPSKENAQTWMKRRESMTLMGMGDESSSSINPNLSSLRDMPGARSVLSIFDVSSNASMRLDCLGMDDMSESDHHAINLSASRRGIAPDLSLGDSLQASFQRQRSLPKNADPRSKFLKVDFTMNNKNRLKGRALANRSTELPPLKEMTDSERDLLKSTSSHHGNE